MKKKSALFFRSLSSLVFICCFCNSSHALNYYWTQAADTSWSNLSNWKIGSYSGAAATVLPHDTDNVFAGNGSANASIYMTISDTINNLTLQGTGNIFINHGSSVSNPTKLFVKGNLTSSNESTTGGGTGYIVIWGTGNQSLTGFSDYSGVGKLPNLIIDKSGGTLTLYGFITMGGTTLLHHVSGTVDADTSTFAFYYNNTLKGSFDFNNVEFICSGGKVKFYNNQTIQGNLLLSGGSYIILDSMTIDIYGNISIANRSKGFIKLNSSTTLNLVGDSNQLIKSFLSGIDYIGYGFIPPVKISKTNGVLSLKGTISLGGNWTNNYSESAINSDSAMLYFYKPDKTVNIGGTYSTPFDTLVFGGADTSTISLQIDTAVLVKHLLLIQDTSKLILTGHSINIEGDILMENSCKSTAITSVVRMVGNKDNNLYGNQELKLYKLIMKKYAGDLYLNNDLRITNELNLGFGNIVASEHGAFILNDGVSLGGGMGGGSGNAISHIEGPITKIGNDPFSFPLGNAGKYRELSISAPDSLNSEFTAEYLAEDQMLGDESDTTIEKIGRCEYWKLTSALETDTVSVELEWGEESCFIQEDLDDMRIAKWDEGNSKWIDLGNGGTTGNQSSGTIITVNNLSAFGFFALAHKFSEMDFVFSEAVQVKEANDSTGIINFHVFGGKNPYEFIFEGNVIPSRSHLNEFFDSLDIDTTSFTNDDYTMINNLKFDSSYIGLNSGVFSAKIIDRTKDTVNIKTLLGQEIDWLVNEGMDVDSVDISIEKINSEQYVLRTSGMDISKSNSNGWNNGELLSQQQLVPGGEIKMEFINDDVSKTMAIGLKNPEVENEDGYTDLSYGLLFQDSFFYAIEDTQNVELGKFESGDRFMIEIIKEASSGGGKGGNANEIGFGLYSESEGEPTESSGSGGVGEIINYYQNGALVATLEFNSANTYVIESAAYSHLAAFSQFVVVSSWMKLKTIYGKIVDSDCGLHNGSINISVMIPMLAGTVVYPEYLWVNSNSETIGHSQNISNLAPGTYTVYYSDGTYNANATFTVGCKVLWNNMVNTSVDAYPNTNILNRTTGQNYTEAAGASSFNKLKEQTAGWFEFPILNSATMVDSWGMVLGLVQNDVDADFTQGSNGVIVCHFMFLNLLLGIDQNLFFLSIWNPNDVIRFSRASGAGAMSVYKNGVLVGSYGTPDDDAEIIDAAMDYVGVNTGKVRCSFECPFVDPYFVLSRSLDGGIYYANDHLKFKFTEEYNEQDNNLSYRILDKNNTAVSGLPTLTSNYGEEYFDIDLTSVSNITLNEVYVLEVKNQKDEKFYLRFKKQ